MDKWKKIRPIMEPFFKVVEGQWRQSRLLDERKARFEFGKSQSQKAKNRHLKNKETNDARVDAQYMPSLSPSLSLLKNKQKEKKSIHVPRPESVSENVWVDFLKVRDKKKSIVTETALKGIEREASRSKISLEDALTIAIEKNWQGFNASWLKDGDLDRFQSKDKTLKTTSHLYDVEGESLPLLGAMQ
jgi:hypothetical protein